MSLNRDIAVLFAASHFPAQKQLRVCDPMTGSGVRAARYLLESPNIRQVIASDPDPAAVNAAARTVELNDLREQVLVFESDANTMLMQHTKERLNLVDLDPFGSPAPFLESALRATMDGGVVAATATDMGPLAGARPTACFRKYAARPTRTEFAKELAVRILAGCLARTACLLGLGTKIAFAHASDHYARIYASITKGKISANRSAQQLGFLEYCPTCLNRGSTNTIESIRVVCENCKSRLHLAGPMWLGQLWDPETVERMVEHAPNLSSNRLSDIQTMLARVEEELSLPCFHYTTETLASKLRIKPPSLAKVFQGLQSVGWKASRTHFEQTGFRTDAPIQELTSALRGVAQKAEA